MPELPEVETIVRTLAPQITGKSIVRVEILHPKVLQAGGEWLSVLPGAVIRRVFRRAKLLLLEVTPVHSAGAGAGKECGAQCVPGVFSGNVLLAFHLKMTGRFFVHPEGTVALKHTRLIFDLLPGESGKAEGELAGRLFFDDMRTFGYCRIMRPEDLEAWSFWTTLGPEPLETSAQDLALRFAACRGAIKGALLDQRVVAGVGNIYADESLFQAGIAPTARAADVSLLRLTALAGSLQRILQKSIEECGSSIRDYRDALGNAGAFQNSFAVYGRKGQPCPVCGAPLTGERVAGRGTVFCLRCQQK